MRKIEIRLSALRYIKSKIKYKLFKLITKKSMGVFLCGNDIISLAPQIEGLHEEFLTKFINKTASTDGSDFFIDIGANIGLTSCQNGNKFKKVVCFEPNPLAANILKTNLSICLNQNNFEVFEFALGDTDGEFELYIPKHNWGGAFVKDNNDYSDVTLSKKDGFDEFDTNNYHVKKVEVKKTVDVLDRLFSSLSAEGFKKGVIKIDVEGFERKILLSIAEKLPKEFDTVIVFENWDECFNIDEIRKAFSSRKLEISTISRSIKRNERKIMRMIKFLIFGQNTNISVYAKHNTSIGDLILTIK